MKRDWGQLQNSASQRVNINSFITGLDIAVNDLPPPKERELLACFVLFSVQSLNTRVKDLAVSQFRQH